MIKRPLLSPNESPASFPDFFKKLQFPLLGSPKFDGIRGVTQSDAVLSRTMKPLPSFQLQDEFTGIMGLDGEIIVGNYRDPGVYNLTQSHVMSFDKPGELSYHVFDCILPDVIHLPFYERLEHAEKLIKGVDKYHFVEHKELNNLEELLEYENEQLMLDLEGIMFRNPVGEYKQGRATYNQNIIYKLKRFEDSEAIILDIVEQMTNNNVLETDERGYAKRSSSKANLAPAGTAGRLIVNWKGLVLDVAMGAFTHAQRKYMWDNKDEFIGQIVKIRYFMYGVKDLPRFPRALGMRSKIDM